MPIEDVEGQGMPGVIPPMGQGKCKAQREMHGAIAMREGGGLVGLPAQTRRHKLQHLQCEMFIHLCIICECTHFIFILNLVYFLSP